MRSRPRCAPGKLEPVGGVGNPGLGRRDGDSRPAGAEAWSGTWGANRTEGRMGSLALTPGPREGGTGGSVASCTSLALCPLRRAGVPWPAGAGPFVRSLRVLPDPAGAPQRSASQLRSSVLPKRLRRLKAGAGRPRKLSKGPRGGRPGNFPGVVCRWEA